MSEGKRRVMHDKDEEVVKVRDYLLKTIMLRMVVNVI